MIILFTKYIKLKNFSFDFDCIPFISIEIYPKIYFQNEISKANNYIITSQNAAKAIEELDLNGKYYVVGQKTAEILLSQNKNVILIENSAKDLAVKLLQLPSQKFIYFSGNLRRNELFEIIQEKHKIQEIEVYKTKLNPQKTDKIYNAIVFFSPSAVKTFFILNDIPKETLIFALGNSTANEVLKYGEFNIKIPDFPTEKAMIDLIRAVFCL